jgi:hypothetical protein
VVNWVIVVAVVAAVAMVAAVVVVPLVTHAVIPSDDNFLFLFPRALVVKTTHSFFLLRRRTLSCEHKSLDSYTVSFPCDSFSGVFVIIGDVGHFARSCTKDRVHYHFLQHREYDDSRIFCMPVYPSVFVLLPVRLFANI